MTKIAFVLIHIGALSAMWLRPSPVALAVCAGLYLLRMFAITAGYHRYFSHRSYETGRVFQFFMAAIGASAMQKGPLWWAACHRHHHRNADKEEDLHSPLRGIWWAHVGWVLSDESESRRVAPVKDFAAFPELQILERFHFVPGLLLLVCAYALGCILQRVAPSLDTSGPQMLVWGAILSTVLVYHGTFAINSLAHLVGRRRFNTQDLSRNSLLLALITLGEGWHNNHHRYPGSERQGYYWWEIDLTHYMLKALSLFGIVWNLKVPPARIYSDAARVDTAPPQLNLSEPHSSPST